MQGATTDDEPMGRNPGTSEAANLTALKVRGCDLAPRFADLIEASGHVPCFKAVHMNAPSTRVKSIEKLLAPRAVPHMRLIVLGNGPRQAIGLRTWIQKCKYELDLSDVVRCATHFASGKISTDADKDRKVEPNQPGELEAVRTHERIAPLTRSSPSRRRRRQDHVFEARRVHPALPAPRLARRLPSHSPLRIPRQWPPDAKARPLSLAPDRRGRTDDVRKDRIANIRAGRNRRL